MKISLSVLNTRKVAGEFVNDVLGIIERAGMQVGGVWWAGQAPKHMGAFLSADAILEIQLGGDGHRLSLHPLRAMDEAERQIVLLRATVDLRRLAA
jgi:hypothetical protein